MQNFKPVIKERLNKCFNIKFRPTQKQSNQVLILIIDWQNLKQKQFFLTAKTVSFGRLF